MYPAIHSLAHRAPPATRARVRWQPYNSLPATTTTSSSSSATSTAYSGRCSPSSTYLNTPAPSVSSSPSPIPCESERSKQQQQPQQPREKNKYALSLVDQAVKSLCEIWPSQDIPVVFLTSSRAVVPGTDFHSRVPTPPPNQQHLPVTDSNTQLPSPVSPSTNPSPPSASIQCNESPDSLLNPRNNVPVKGFVHEVLRRSRTSGTVLQTALCYLEAIRGRIPELIQQEKAGECTHEEMELDSRITPATEAEFEQEALLSAAESSCSSGMPTIIANDSLDDMDTVRITDADSHVPIELIPVIPPSPTTAATRMDAKAYGLGEDVTNGDDTLKKAKSAGVLAPLPPLPSPLLCPRRAFLAALILASKFTQDKCYSNRAWAKLSGLPPREIGRCERALGDALDWRLWVGKSPVSSTAAGVAQPTPQAPTPPATTKPVARCQSEANLRSTPCDRTGFLTIDNGNAPARAVESGKIISHVSTRPVARRPGSGLRRASTLPAEAFSSTSSVTRIDSKYYNNNVVAQWIIDNQGQSHAGQIDQEMHSPQVDSEYDANAQSSSPYPPTPGLSYSPSSTESSIESGDRTIQMSAFLSFDDGAAAGSFGSVGSLNTLMSGCGVAAPQTTMKSYGDVATWMPVHENVQRFLQGQSPIDPRQHALYHTNTWGMGMDVGRVVGTTVVV